MGDPRAAVGFTERQRALAARGNAKKRFMQRVEQEPNSGCWLWNGPTVKGYGRASIQSKEHMAHRVSYEMFVGPIPSGAVIDHLCRTTLCVNPKHLEAVSHAENMRRGRNAMRERTHCKNGHAYTEKNTRVAPQGHRLCRRCQVLGSQRYQAKQRLINAGRP
jgi:hypothetical protein